MKAKRIPFVRRFWISVAIVVFNATLYFATNNYQFFPEVLIEPSWVDDQIPYMPWTTTIYCSYYLILFLPLWMCDDEFVFYQMAKACIAITLIYNTIFFFLPTRFVFDHTVYNDIFSTWIMIPMREVDNHGINAFPSEHTAFGLIGGLTYLKYKYWNKGTLFLIWGTGITISTMTVKQHFFIDAAVSVVIVLMLVFLLEEDRPEQKESSSGGGGDSSRYAAQSP